MTSDELCWLSATDLAALIRRRKVSPVEVIDAVLERIGRLNHEQARPWANARPGL